MVPSVAAPRTTVSPTEAGTLARCAKRWWYRHVARIVDVERPKGAVLGDAAHALLEELHGGKPAAICADIKPQATAVLSRALPFLPAPSPGVASELTVRAPRGGHTWKARVDLSEPASRLVIDLKTSSNPRKYGLTADTIRDDLQALACAAGALHLWGDPPSVNLRWVYTSTRTKVAYPVAVTMTRAEVNDRLSKHDPYGASAVAMRSLPVLESDLPPNPDACGDYGGCAYIAACSYAKHNPLSAAIAAFDEGTDTMTTPDPAILAMIAGFAQQGNAAPAQPSAPPPPQPAAQPAQPDPQQAAIAAAMAAMGKAQPSAPPPPQPAAQPAQPDPQQAAIAAAMAAMGKAQQPAAPPPQPAAAPDPQQAAIAAAMAAMGKAQQPAAPPPGHSVTMPIPFEPPVERRHEPGYTLFVGCVPLGPDAEYDLADALISSAEKSAALANNVQHYREIDWGKGHAALVYQLEKLLKGWSRDIVLLPGRESSDAASSLRRFARRIIQGV